MLVRNSTLLDNVYGLDSFIPRDSSTLDIPTDEVVQVAEASTVIFSQCDRNRNVKIWS
jgi:hypothetical protein